MSPRKGETHEEFIARKHQSYLQNREKILAKNKIWRDGHKEHTKAYMKKWVAENWATKYASNRRWIIKHPDKSVAYTRKWQKANPEKAKAVYRNWVKNNPDARRVTRKQGNHKRNARFRSIPFEDCSEKIALLNKERFCRWCCTRLSDAIKTIDHIIPLARGGHHISDNLAAACRKCNFSRGDKLVSEWLPNQEFNN